MRPSSRPWLAFDVGGETLPVGFGRDVERGVDPGRTGEIGGDRDATGVTDGRHRGGADGATGTRYQDDLVGQVNHTHLYSVVRAP